MARTQERVLTKSKLPDHIVIHVPNNISSIDLPRRRHIIKQHTAQVAWLLISVLCIIPVGGHALEGLLLCVGSDGHVEVESSTGLLCDTFLGAQNHVLEFEKGIANKFSGVDHHCGSCLDIPLLNAGDKDCGAIESKPVLHPQLIGVTPITGCDVHLFPSISQTRSTNSGKQIPPATRSELRTVILLI